MSSKAFFIALAAVLLPLQGHTAVTSTELGKMLLGLSYSQVNQAYLAYNTCAPTSATTSCGKGYHPGIDYRAAAGTPVYAPVTGTVTYTDISSAGFGTIAVQMTNSTKRFIFLHMSNAQVAVGTKITQGCVVGYSGSLGATAAHLHVEVRDGKNVGAYYFTSSSSTGSNSDPAAAVASYIAVNQSKKCG